MRNAMEPHLRWTADGEVRFKDVDFRESAPPAKRLVKLASVNHRPRGTSSQQESRERFVALVEQAAERGADIDCLPEGLTAAGNGLTYAQAAESVPGPTTEFLDALARRLPGLSQKYAAHHGKVIAHGEEHRQSGAERPGRARTRHSFVSGERRL